LAYGKRELFIGSYEIIGVSPENIQGFKAEQGIGGALLASINGEKAKAHSLESRAPRISINTTSALMRAGALGKGAGIEVNGSESDVPDGNVTLTSGPDISIVVGPSSIVLRAGPTSLEITREGINIVAPRNIKMSAGKSVEVAAFGGMKIGGNVKVDGGIGAKKVLAGSGLGPAVDLATHQHGPLPMVGLVPAPLKMAALALTPVIPPFAPDPVMPVGFVHESINLAEDLHNQKANLAAAITKDPQSPA
jgi:hypothetical protein